MNKNTIRSKVLTTVGGCNQFVLILLSKIEKAMNDADASLI